MADVSAEEEMKIIHSLELKYPLEDYDGFDKHERKSHTGNALEVMKRLLALGADPDYPDSEGRTPLFWAVDHNQVDAIILLLYTQRVDPYFEANDGRSPVSLANRWILWPPPETDSESEVVI